MMGMEEDPDPKNAKAVASSIFIAVAVYAVRRHLLPSYPPPPPSCFLLGQQAGRSNDHFGPFLGYHEKCKKLTQKQTGIHRFLRLTSMAARTREPEGRHLPAMRGLQSGESLDEEDCAPLVRRLDLRVPSGASLGRSEGAFQEQGSIGVSDPRGYAVAANAVLNGIA